jgi:hypothetical protein
MDDERCDVLMMNDEMGKDRIVSKKEEEDERS